MKQVLLFLLTTILLTGADAQEYFTGKVIYNSENKQDSSAANPAFEISYGDGFIKMFASQSNIDEKDRRVTVVSDFKNRYIYYIDSADKSISRMDIPEKRTTHLPQKLSDTSFLVNGYQATLHYRTAGSIPLDIYYSDSLKIKIPDEYIFNEDMAFFNMNRLLLKVDFYPLKRKGKFDFSGNLLSAVNIIPMPADSVVFSLPAGFTLIDLPGESPKADAAAKKKLPLKSKNNSSLKNKKKPAPVKSPSAGKTN